MPHFAVEEDFFFSSWTSRLPQLTHVQQQPAGDSDSDTVQQQQQHPLLPLPSGLTQEEANWRAWSDAQQQLQRQQLQQQQLQQLQQQQQQQQQDEYAIWQVHQYLLYQQQLQQCQQQMELQPVEEVGETTEVDEEEDSDWKLVRTTHVKQTISIFRLQFLSPVHSSNSLSRIFF